jgi:toxin-antitoxin system PIN domain toxin
VKLLDANVLLYAINADAPHHTEAKAWLEAALSGTESVALSWSVILAVLRLSTRPLVFSQPLPIETALGIVEAWLAQPCVTIVEPTARHFAVLADLLRPIGAAGNLTTDAHLAALAIEHGAELCSTDHDFARFVAVRWVNPLV